MWILSQPVEWHIFECLICKMRKKHISQLGQEWHVSSAFLFWTRLCVMSGHLVWTGHVQWNIQCHVGMCGCTVEKSISCSPSIKRCSLEEADPAVVGLWYLCCFSLLNCDSLQPSTATVAPHQPVSSLHFMSVCLKKSLLILSLTAITWTRPVDLTDIHFPWSSQQYC